MSYQRILTVQDISCVGQCSLTVALPILSACGLETCILPSALLSTHTAGFHDYTCRDLTEDMPRIAAHWKREGILFDAFYTGYLGSIEEISCVKSVFSTLGRPDCRTVVDPAMADNGVLYPAFDEAYARAMRPLCFGADVMLPNLTEACMLTDTPYPAHYDEAFVTGILQKLSDAGAGTVILTGVGYTEDTTGVVVYENGRQFYYRHHRFPRLCHGTGDIYASAFTGAYLQGLSVFDAARLAADFTLRCIENTMGDEAHWYGMKFETALPELTARIAEISGGGTV